MSRYFYFLHAFKLPSALIAQGLAEKNPERSEDDFFQPTSPTGPPCTVSGKGRYLL